jgi:hypothetical protein
MRVVIGGAAILVALALPATAAAQPTGQPVALTPAAELPTSVENVREGLSREQVLRLEAPPIFRVEITERRPRDWDLQSPFDFTFEPRTFGSWHDQLLTMTTPDEARMYSPMYSSADTAMVAATSLLFAGAVSLLKAKFTGTPEGKARKARKEVDAALEAFEAARQPN